MAEFEKTDFLACIEGYTSKEHLTKDSNDVIYLAPEENFTINMKNNYRQPVIARVFMSNRDIGSYILLPGEFVKLERSINSQEKFKMPYSNDLVPPAKSMHYNEILIRVHPPLTTYRKHINVNWDTYVINPQQVDEYNDSNISTQTFAKVPGFPTVGIYYYGFVLKVRDNN